MTAGPNFVPPDMSMEHYAEGEALTEAVAGHGSAHVDDRISIDGVQPDPTLVEWSRPPDRRYSRAQVVKATLATMPRRWARICIVDRGIRFLSWYHPLLRDPHVETRWVHKESGLYPPRDLYARYIGPDPEDSPYQSSPDPEDQP